MPLAMPEAAGADRRRRRRTRHAHQLPRPPARGDAAQGGRARRRRAPPPDDAQRTHVARHAEAPRVRRAVLVPRGVRGAQVDFPWTEEDPDADWRAEPGETADEIAALYRDEMCDIARQITAAASLHDIVHLP